VPEETKDLKAVVVPIVIATFAGKAVLTDQINDSRENVQTVETSNDVES
jgi:hypothetical protein